MKSFLRRVIRIGAYLAGGLVIVLAIAVGLFRLFLPRLPEYQEDIKGWASAAIGLYVEFSGMDARWGLSGPEVEFYNAELIAPDTMARIIAAEQVSVGVAPARHAPMSVFPPVITLASFPLTKKSPWPLIIINPSSPSGTESV